MIKKSIFLLLCIQGTVILCQESLNSYLSTDKLRPYKDFLKSGTNNFDWSYFNRKPKSRYTTFKHAFRLFEESHGTVIVELGTTRSFVDGKFPGCNSNNVKYWAPNNPERWDWGAGCFTRMATECLHHTKPNIHTVDIAREHINRCRVITQDFKDNITYHVTSSEKFLEHCPFSIDFLYLDTGNMTPIEETAQLHLREAKIIVRRNLIPQGGLILIDDVRHPAPKMVGESSDYGKAKYSLAYFLEHGFEIIDDEFQVLLRKK